MSAEQQNNEEVTIDLRRLFILIRKHIISILIWMIGLGLIAYGVSEYVLVPKYTASTQLLVNRQADINAVTTYKDIITSNVILKGASKYLANPVTLVKKATPAKKAVYKTNDGTRTLVKKAVKAKPAVYKRESKSYSVSANELASAVSVTTTTSSQVFTLSATAETPAKAQAIANAVAKEFKEQIPKIMDVNNVTIFVAEAAKGTKSYPNVKMITMVGVLAGLVISLLIIIIKDLSDTTVREDSFMTNELGLTNLGEIAHITMPKDWTFTAKTAEKRGSSRRRV
ncbi:YveK family protein [Lactobacillus delbrueckii]|uniref:YveK family protein n=1 Tax=Lactobacillus delbrueckii TaxID=1584 RepID=UPI00073970D9|nr:Wzz/FepE/Etk N-terminal domain-containing protein [Lactobacillus delbrueckii]CUS16833.1 Capsular polysaccharide biosynthesis protein [Lactobacillus delbrueckii subsp. bulgaricus]